MCTDRPVDDDEDEDVTDGGWGTNTIPDSESDTFNDEDDSL